MRAKHAIFAAVPSLIGLAVVAGAWYRMEPLKTATEKGKDLNQRAWEASFTERGLPVPEGGPREGYWGSLVNPSIVKHASIGWLLANVIIPGRVESDASGVQHWRSRIAPSKRVLILGGSVAWGAYASSIDAAYFAVMGRDLETRGVPVAIDVLAAPGWTSANEASALANYVGPRPDVVIVLDALNDLAAVDQPSDAQNVFVGAHDGNFTARLDRYRASVATIANACYQRNVRLIVALQPSITERASLTAIEKQCLTATWEDNPGSGLSMQDGVRASYAYLRTILKQAESTANITFVDVSSIFDKESATTFVDLWHFSDPGHAILGKALAAQLAN